MTTSYSSEHSPTSLKATILEGFKHCKVHFYKLERSFIPCFTPQMAARSRAVLGESQNVRTPSFFRVLPADVSYLPPSRVAISRRLKLNAEQGREPRHNPVAP